MKSKDRVSTRDMVTSRRRFLKSSGAAGVALAGGLGAETSVAVEESVPVASAGQCAFSALPADFVYLNSGTEGSMPSCVISTFQDGLKQWASDPTTSYEADPAYGKRQEMNRTEVGQFLDVGMNNICLTDNTTMGLSMTLMGLDFQPDDRVVVTNHEHTAIKAPFRWDKPQQVFTDRKTADWVVAELMKKKIQVRSIGFENSGSPDRPSDPVYAIRVSTGFFNTADTAGFPSLLGSSSPRIAVAYALWQSKVMKVGHSI